MENYILLLVIISFRLPETELEPSGAGLFEEEPKFEGGSAVPWAKRKNRKKYFAKQYLASLD